MHTVHQLSIILLGILLLVGSAAAAPGYSLSGSSDSVSIPTRQVDDDKGTATINSVSSTTETGSVTVQTSIDAGKKKPELQVRDQGEATLTYRDPVSDGDSFSFESGTFIPSGSSEVTAGTYAAVLYSSSTGVVAAHPIVVQGYDIKCKEVSGTGDGDGTATISMNFEQENIPLHSDLKQIDVIVGNEDKEVQKEMTDSDGDGTYTADISTNSLSEKTYNTYVVFLGDEQVLGEDEILAISNTFDLNVGSSADDADGCKNNDDDDDNDDEENVDDNGNGDQAGGQSGGQGGTQDNAGSTTDDAPPTPQDVKDNLNLVDPESEVTLNSDPESVEEESEQTEESSDADEDSSQTSDATSNSVTEVEFTDGNQQSVTVENYGTPPEQVEKEVINSIAAYNSDVNPATDSGVDTATDGSNTDDDESESGVIEPTPSSESDSSSETGDASTTEEGSDTRVVALSDISPQEETDDEETAATVTMSVNEDDVTNPEQLTVYKEEYVFEAQEEQWIELETTVTDSTGGSLEVTAETTGFSLFAITETIPNESESTDSDGSTDEDNASQTDDQDDADQTENQTPGFGISTMAVTLLIAVLMARTTHSN